MPPSRRPVTGPSQIRENYQLLFDNYDVVLFELHPEETRIEGSWAFERGVVRAQLTPREGAVQLSEEAVEALEESARGQQARPSQEEPFDIARGTFVRSDLGSYVAVLQRVDEGWKLRWAIGNNPPEARIPVIAETGQPSN